MNVIRILDVPNSIKAFEIKKFLEELGLRPKRVKRFRDSDDKDVAYVYYSRAQDINVAMSYLSKEKLGGHTLEADVIQLGSKNSKIFLGNLSQAVTERILMQAFLEFGDILKARIDYDEFGRSKGTGNITFEKEESAQQAISQKRGRYLLGVRIFVGKFVDQEETDRLIFVSNFPEYTTTEQIKDMCERYATVESIKMLVDLRMKKTCRVCINTYEGAEKVINILNGHSYYGFRLRVTRFWKQRKTPFNTGICNRNQNPMYQSPSYPGRFNVPQNFKMPSPPHFRPSHPRTLSYSQGPHKCTPSSSQDFDVRPRMELNFREFQEPNRMGYFPEILADSHVTPMAKQISQERSEHGSIYD